VIQVLHISIHILGVGKSCMLLRFT